MFYQSEQLLAEGVRHAFSTRIGGVSSGVYDSLNLGNPLDAAEPDSLDHIEQNYDRLAMAAGLPGERAAVHQVHGCGVVSLGSGTEWSQGQKADAIVSDDPRRCVSIRTADCAAVLLASAGGALVAGVHAGWRGVVEGVITQAMKVMRDRGRPAVVGAVFPCIGYEAFEVGQEVVESFCRVVGNDVVREVGGGKGRVDLAGACARQMEGGGISRSRIDLSGLCTVTETLRFFSHRRDGGKTGRMALVALANGTEGSL